MMTLSDEMDDAEKNMTLVGESAAVDGSDFETSNDDSAWLLDEEMDRLRSAFNLSGASSVRPMSSQINADWDLSAVSAAHHFNNQSNSTPTATASTESSAANVSPNRQNRPVGIIAWAILSLGLMSFCCGGVLLAWSFLAHRSDLWSLGLPMALVGQFGLLLGLVLQLEHLWHANRRTADTLTHVDERLSEINHATTLLQSKNGSSGQSFYMHMAENAHPHLLLADLKGQLDLLANKLSQQR